MRQHGDQQQRETAPPGAGGTQGQGSGEGAVVELWGQVSAAAGPSAPAS